MAKVCLINPSEKGILENNGDRPPLGLLYLASAIRDKHDVKVFDLNHKEACQWQIELIKFNPEYVGISFTTPMYERAILLNTTIKSLIKTKTIAGGSHPSADPKSCKDFDYIVVGEGEKSILRILNENNKK